MSAALLVLAVAAAASTKTYTADLALLRPVTRAGYQAEPFDAPFVSVFDDGTKRLVFVSGDHAAGMRSAGARTVRRAVSRHKPGIIVVEGLKGGDEAGTREWLEQARYFVRHAPKSIPENYHAAHAGDKAGGAVFGGEPSLAALRAAAARAGFTDEDLLGFLMARNIPAWSEDGPLTPQALRRSSEHYLPKVSADLGFAPAWHWNDFLRWYERKAGLARPPETLSYDDVGPHEGPDPTFLQRISLSLDRMREENIVRTIELALKNSDRVLVVYGSGHLVKQRPVWSRMFGASKDSKPYGESSKKR